jgi:hypothetical protein
MTIHRKVIQFELRPSQLEAAGEEFIHRHV